MPYHAIIQGGENEGSEEATTGGGGSTLQPVEVGVAGFLVLVFLLVESSPEGAGRVV